MGGWCNSGNTVNQSQTYSPNPYAMSAISGALNQGQQVAQTPFHTPVAPVAGFSNDQQQAFQGVRNAQGQAQPYLNAAQDYFGGARVGDFMNPYASNVMAGMKDLFGSQQQQTTGNLTAQAGGVGADRIGVGQAELVRQQQLAAGQTLGGMYKDAMSASQNAGFGIGALGPVAQNASLQGAQAQLGTGGLQQQLQQAQMNAPYQNILQQIQWPYQNAQFNASLTGALAPGLGGTTSGQTQYPQQSPWGTIAGLGMAGAGVYGIGNQQGWWGGSGGQGIGDSGSGSDNYASGGRINPYADGGATDDMDDQIHSAEIKELQDAGNPSAGGFHAGAIPNGHPIDVSQQSMIPTGQIQPIQPHIPQLPQAQQQSGGGFGSTLGGIGSVLAGAAKIIPLLNQGGAVHGYAEGGVPSAMPQPGGMSGGLGMGGMQGAANMLNAGNPAQPQSQMSLNDARQMLGGGQALTNLFGRGMPPASGQQPQMGLNSAGQMLGGGQALTSLLSRFQGANQNNNPWQNYMAQHGWGHRRGFAEGGAAKGESENPGSGNSPYYDKFLKALDSISRFTPGGPDKGKPHDPNEGLWEGFWKQNPLSTAMLAMRPSGVRLAPTNHANPQLQLRGRFTRPQEHGAYMQHPAVGKWPFIASGQLASNLYGHDDSPTIEHEALARHDDAGPMAQDHPVNPFADRFGGMAPPTESMGPKQDPLFLQSGMQQHQQSDFVPPSAYKRPEPLPDHVPIPRSNPFLGPALNYEAKRREASAAPEPDRPAPYRPMHMAAGGGTPEPAWPFLEGMGQETPPETPDMTRALPDYESRDPNELAMLRHREMVRPKAGRQDFPMEHLANMATGAAAFSPLGAALAPEMLAGRGLAAAAQYAPKTTLSALSAFGAYHSGSEAGAMEPDKVKEIQTRLKQKGMYNGPIDGIMKENGPTEKAYKAEQESEHEAERLRVQSQGNEATMKTAEANQKAAEAQIKASELEEKRLERKRLADERIRDLDKNLPLSSRIMRDYSGPAGMVAGATLGSLGRYATQAAADKAIKATARAGNEIMAGDVALGKKGAELATARAARANEFWRKGGAKEVPFLLEPGNKAGFAVNPKTTPLSKTYNPQIHPAVEAAAAAPAGIEFGVANHYKTQWENELRDAEKELSEDASEANIQRLNKAKDNVGLFTGLERAGQTALGVQGVGAAGSRWLNKGPTMRPNMQPAEAEQASLQKILRDAADRATKKSAPKSVLETGEAAPALAAVRASRKSASMRKFDNQGNLIRSRARKKPPTEEMPAAQAAGGRIHANPYGGSFEDAGAVPFLTSATPDTGSDDWRDVAERAKPGQPPDWIGNTAEGIRGSMPPGGIPVGYKFPTLSARNASGAVPPVAMPNGEEPEISGDAESGYGKAANPFVGPSDEAAPTRSRGKDLIDNPWMALVQVGLGTMAAAGTRDARGLPTSPAAAIGQGGLKGMEELRHQQTAGMKQQSIEQAAKRLDQQAQFHQLQFKETQQHHRALEDFQKQRVGTGAIDDEVVNRRADRIGNYLEPPPGPGSRDPQAKAAMDKVREKYPDYRASRYAGEAAAEKIIATADPRAQSNAISALEKQSAGIQAFENTARKNGQLLVGLADKVDTTGMPVIERWIRAGRNAIAGDPDVSNFNLQYRLYTAEVAKIIANPNLTGVLSDTARKEISEALSPSASAVQIKAAVKLLEKDFDNRTEAINETKAALQKKLGESRPGYVAPPPAASTPPPPAASATNPLEGAKQAADGKWYVPDPARPGKYLEVRP